MQPHSPRSVEALSSVAAASSRRWRNVPAAGSRRYEGYTLIELLLVCAILAALTSMSLPAMRGMLSKGRLKQAADDLETTLHRTRLRAIESGTTLVLRYAPGGRTFRVEPWDTIGPDEPRDRADDEYAAYAAADPLIDESAVQIAPIAKELPEGVRFAAADPLESVRQPAWPADAANVEIDIAEESGAYGPAASEPELSETIAFYANGRSANAAIRLVNERRFFIDVTLRGLTGQVSTTAAARLPPAEPSLPADESFGGKKADTSILESE